MTQALRLLGLHEARWTRLTPASLWVAMTVAGGASIVLSLDRFGGLMVETPRAFTRMALVGIYGWLGLSTGIWLAALLARSRNEHADTHPHVAFTQSLVVVGFAHVPVLILGVVIFLSATMLQLFGPGTVAAWFVLAFWFPAVLVSATRSTWRLSLYNAALVVAITYAAWVLTAGRHLLGQVQHLL